MDSKDDKLLAELLIAARNGDDAAYRRFLKATADVLRRYLRTRVKSDSVIEDILQDTLISVHSARHTYVTGRLVGPWLFAICRHRMVDYFRKLRRIERYETACDDVAIDSHATEPTFAHDDPRIALAERAIARLPAAQRKIVELINVRDLSVKEVAELTGMSESAVKVSAHRAYAKIRKWSGVSNNEN